MTRIYAGKKEVDEWQEFIHKNGSEYISAPLPKKFKRHKIGHCFGGSVVECVRAYERGTEYMYVEGLVVVDDREPILHAWITDGEHAYDVIWYATDDFGNKRYIPKSRIKYIGVPMKLESVIEWLRGVKYDGIMGNRWRNPELADNAIYSIIGKDLMTL